MKVPVKPNDNEVLLNRLLPLEAVNVRLAAKPADVISIAPLAVKLITDEPPTFTLNVSLVLTANPADEIVRDTLVTFGGHIVHPRVCEAFGLPAPTNAIANGNVK